MTPVLLFILSLTPRDTQIHVRKIYAVLEYKVSHSPPIAKACYDAKLHEAIRLESDLTTKIRRHIPQTQESLQTFMDKADRIESDSKWCGELRFMMGGRNSPIFIIEDHSRVTSPTDKTIDGIINDWDQTHSGN